MKIIKLGRDRIHSLYQRIFQPQTMNERYLSFLPSPKTGSAYLFSKPKVLSKMFNFMDPCFMKITSKLELTLNETCFRNFAMQLDKGKMVQYEHLSRVLALTISTTLVLILW